MIVDKIENGNLNFNDPYSQGIIIYPETEIELAYIEDLLENLEEIKKFFEMDAKQRGINPDDMQNVGI